MAEQTYATDKTDDYLTMARIMEKELFKHMKTVYEANRMRTGIEDIELRGAFQAGFMAGFCLKFTGEK
jgi:hypothetical protein